MKPLCDTIRASKHLAENVKNHMILFLFLSEIRPQIAKNFIRDCEALYIEKYKGKRGEETRQTNQAGNGPRQTSNADANGRPKERPGATDPSSRREDEVAVVETTETPEERDARIEARSAQILEEEKPIPQRPFIKNAWFRQRMTTWPSLSKRAVAFKKGLGKSQNPVTQDGNFIIWSTEKGNVQLSREFCSLLTSLTDSDKRISGLTSDALRFLWHYFCEDLIGGAVFNHGVGYPRAHLVLTFCHLALTKMTSPDKLESVIVYCPKALMRQWIQGTEACQMDDVIYLADAQYLQHIQKWKKEGGILICSLELLNSILAAPASDDRREIYQAMISPGPHLCILDEASRLPSFPPRVRRALNKTRSRARLALTSMPVGGNLIRAYSVYSWATPDLFGSMEEFWTVYMRHLVSNNKEALLIAQHLLKVIKDVTFRITDDLRTSTLEEKGSILKEATVYIPLGGNHKSTYEALVPLVHEAVAGGMSKFVGVHLLLTAASSPTAAHELLANGLRYGANLVRPGQMESSLSNLKKNFALMKEKIGEMITSNLRSIKIEFSLQMCNKWVDVNQRVALFISSRELYMQVKSRFLDAYGEKVNCYELSDRFKTKKLERFNKAREGSILLAPYGATIECIEDSAWGFVNANHVIVMDFNWNPSLRAQVVDRVLNFATKGIVRVFHLVAADTLEVAIVANLARAYATHEPIGDKKLLLPFIKDDLFTSPTPLPPQSEAENEWDEEATRLVHDINPKAIVSTDLSQYAMSSKSLEMVIQPKDVRDVRVAECLVFSLTKTYMESIPNLTHDIESMVSKKNRFFTWRDTRVSVVPRLYFEPSLYRTNCLIACWDEYFRIYEQLEQPEILTEET